MAQVITQIEMMRYQGAPLAVFKLSHCIKMFIMTALFTALFLGGVTTIWPRNCLLSS